MRGIYKTVSDRGAISRELRVGFRNLRTVKSSSLLIMSVFTIIFGAIFRDLVFDIEYLQILGFSLQIFDTIFLVVLATFVFGAILSNFQSSFSSFFAWVLIFAALLSIFRGIIVDASQALVWIRAEFATLLFVLVAATLKITANTYRAAGIWMVRGAWLLAGLVYTRWLISPGFPFFDTTLGENEGRPLSAMAAFVLACGALWMALESNRVKPSNRNKTILQAAILGLAVVLSGQGTANIAYMLMLLTAIFIQSRLPLRLKLFFVLSFSTAVMVGYLLGIHEVSWSGVGDEAFIEQRLINREFRQNIWAAAIYEFKNTSLLNQLVGFPAGDRPIINFITPRGDLVAWEFSLHSHYFGLLLNLGIVGLMTWSTLVALTSFRALRLAFRSKDATIYGFQFACIVGSLTMSYSYELREGALVVLLFAFCDPSKLDARRPIFGAKRPLRPLIGFR